MSFCLIRTNENLGPDDGLVVSEGLAALPTIPDMTEYRNIAAASISRNLGIADTYMLKFRYRLTTEYFYHNYERQIRDEAIRINAYFGFQNFDFKQYSHFEINNPAYSGTPTLPSHVAGTGDIYNSEQLRILDAYFYEMYNFKTANDLSLNYAYGQQMVRDSPLSMEEKYVVLACIESGNEFGKKYLSGAWSGVRIDLGATLNESTSGCSMNWKQVWQGAVIGGFIGAGRGVWIGAAGGTVALPGFGTVSGPLAALSLVLLGALQEEREQV